VHSAQGLTTDRMMVDLDTRSLTTGKDLYYVAISRARYEATIYTNSRAELPAAISREAAKTAALDIQRERPIR
jgi:ATP-dependent exoDNAse (exonuclease V) alpha subunit